MARDTNIRWFGDLAVHSCFSIDLVDYFSEGDTCADVVNSEPVPVFLGAVLMLFEVQCSKK